MARHTEEPWYTDSRFFPASIFSQERHAEPMARFTYGEDRAFGMDHDGQDIADADRACACVNALVGVEGPTKEKQQQMRDGLSAAAKLISALEQMTTKEFGRGADSESRVLLRTYLEDLGYLEVDV